MKFPTSEKLMLILTVSFSLSNHKESSWLFIQETCIDMHIYGQKIQLIKFLTVFILHDSILVFASYFTNNYRSESLAFKLVYIKMYKKLWYLKNIRSKYIFKKSAANFLF